MCPVDCAKTHGAGLAGREDFAAAEVEGFQFLTGGADGADLGVGRGVAVGGHAVYAGGDDFAVAGYHCAERAAAVGYVFF